MNDEKFEGYIYDTIGLLKDQAKVAKLEADNPKEGEEDFNQGELRAYYEVFALLKEKACVFNIDEKKIGLDDIDPNRDLYSGPQKLDK